MRIVSKNTLRHYCEQYPAADDRLRAWHSEVKQEDWDMPAKVKEKYRNASIFGGNRVVFNIRGNNYRLVVSINYRARIVYLRFFGAHAEYDAIEVTEM